MSALGLEHEGKPNPLGSEGSSAVHVRQWQLEPETEYRFELDPGNSLAIKLVDGQAEIFGAELAEGSIYVFGMECKAAVYTWQGCTIEMTSTEYISEETPMNAYANVHLALEQMRVRALRVIHGSPPSDDDEADMDPNPEPPRVLVLGPENSGKTTVSKILVNYAVRMGQDWNPIFANVDPGEGGWAVPGVISAASITAPLQTSSPAATLGSAATSAPVHLVSNELLPLSYWYGHAETRRNPLLMDRLIRNLGENIAERWDADAECRAAGLIVDTPASFASSSGPQGDHRHALIKACVDAFRINVILVVGHEKLNVEMQRAYGNRISIVKIPKSGGVVELDSSYRERVRKYQLQNYMYGKVIPPPPGLSALPYLQGGEQTSDLTLNLAPSSSVIMFSDLVIYRIGEETMAPTSALPIGAARVVSEMQPLIVDPAQPGSGLYNAVLALLSPPNPDESERYDEEILDLSVVGFLVITALDIPNKRMTVLAPGQGSFAGRTAIVGSFEWQE
ncbi:uncharacterized protein FIBRA_02562 [Fibroporia radiculosa]|uniref:Polynucleotide 5'-hydroxyl-kinase GRC3 n=1 Tax=Fibroporia radiculosa TaxID=599839 RepID=J4G1V5_9APHY|nr:uncharacterized protein FIBRA_02562 [Fibroporia radiculosa]CCM00528.1 predicted protein [Fibroporia radiculosa]